MFGLFTALLVIASSCSDEEFRCKSGECLSNTLVCDFKTDCENGSEEEFCGKHFLINSNQSLFVCFFFQLTEFIFFVFVNVLFFFAEPVNSYFLTKFSTVSPFAVKGRATLKVTLVDGWTPVTSPTAGQGRWQTSPQYLAWTIPQGVRQVSFNVLLFLLCCQ